MVWLMDSLYFYSCDVTSNIYLLKQDKSIKHIIVWLFEFVKCDTAMDERNCGIKSILLVYAIVIEHLKTTYNTQFKHVWKSCSFIQWIIRRKNNAFILKEPFRNHNGRRKVHISNFTTQMNDRFMPSRN